QHMNGLLEPTEGQVLVDGEDINVKGCNRRAVRQKVGLVFQYPEYQLFDETVIKDVGFGPKNLGLTADQIDARVREALAHVELDYDTVGSRSPFELSGGQMRRVAIAGVLAIKPRVLVLDEPTSGLDPRGRAGILGMIQSLYEQGGLTVIMVTHNMDEIARLATRLCVMKKGRLMMTGTPGEVFKNPDLIDTIGLSVPQAARLAHALRQRGIQIQEGIYLMDEAEQAIARLLEARYA
ncbi:MAG: ATP-binding cassette domain-containing protein, partial [Clostridia bacterium]|nr:ATP-binding cassette domain-containing protein [Clostridia bacterium]